MRTNCAIDLVIATFVVTAAPNLAHHGHIGYSDQEFEFTATVEQNLRLIHPHAIMLVRADDGVWRLFFGAIVQFSELKEDTFSVGDAVRIVGRRHLDPSRFEVWAERVDWGDRMFDFVN